MAVFVVDPLEVVHVQRQHRQRHAPAAWQRRQRSVEFGQHLAPRGDAGKAVDPHFAAGAAQAPEGQEQHPDEHRQQQQRRAQQRAPQGRLALHRLQPVTLGFRLLRQLQRRQVALAAFRFGDQELRLLALHARVQFLLHAHLRLARIQCLAPGAQRAQGGGLEVQHVAEAAQVAVGAVALLGLFGQRQRGPRIAAALGDQRIDVIAARAHQPRGAHRDQLRFGLLPLCPRLRQVAQQRVDPGRAQQQRRLRPLQRMPAMQLGRAQVGGQRRWQIAALLGDGAFALHRQRLHVAAIALPGPLQDLGDDLV
ncbi:hypothetical protein NB723_003009 [Xanthomonas sacchari]|nr:hypothetical protein [Xanthomonas sacchari]